MTDLAVTDTLFFERTGMDPVRIEALVNQSLSGMDDGELYLEYSQSESLALDDGRIKSASFDTTQGFGLRAVAAKRLATHASGARARPRAGNRASRERALWRAGAGPPGTTAASIPSRTPRSADLGSRSGFSPRSTPCAAATRVKQVSGVAQRRMASGADHAPDGRRVADIARWCG
jgi:TldD protein